VGGLKPKDLMLDDLARSGLDAKSIEQIKVKALTREATGKLLNSKSEDDCLVSYQIPYFTLDGKPTKDFYRVRFLEEPPKGKFGAEKKPRRYTQPKDEPPRFYLPPIIDWSEVANDTDIPLTFTEGEKKSAAACQNGIACIGLGGVWSWRSKAYNLPHIRDFKEFTWKGRQVFLCFDNDLWDNDKVLHALTALASKLHEFGAYVSFKFLPEGVEKIGLDDYLLDHNAEDFEDLETESYTDLEQLIELNTKWCLLKKHNAFMNIEDREIFSSRKALQDNLFGNRFIERFDGDGTLRRVNLFNEWCTWENRREHVTVAYKPEKPEVTDENEINTWLGWGVEPEKGDIKPFEDLVNFIFEGLGEHELKWLWQWFAYPIQHAGAKLKTSVLVHGEAQQTGKTFIGYILGDIYGKNFGVVDNSEITDKYNTWCQYKQFILAEEVSSTDRRSINDRIKRLITGEEIILEGKHRNKIEIDNTLNFYFTSQHRDALFIETHDERFFIHHMNRPRNTPEFYARIDKWRREQNGAAKLMHHLKYEVDLAGFNPLGVAPMTQAKEEMKRSSASSLENWVYDLIHNLSGEIYHHGNVIKKHWFIAQELVEIYQDETKNKTTDKALTNAVVAAGGISSQLRVVRPEKGTKAYPTKLWCVRDIEEWKKKEKRQRKDLFKKAVKENYEGGRSKLQQIEGDIKTKKGK